LSLASNFRIALTHLLKEMGLEDRIHLGFSSFYYLLFPFHNRKSMFAVLHSNIISLKFGLLHLTGQPYCKKSRLAKAKDGIINLILRNYLVDRYIVFEGQAGRRLPK
jgi:hypothetical protein